VVLVPVFPQSYNLVISVNSMSEPESLRLNDHCRNVGAHFIATGSHGLFGYCFVDLGDAFVVHDKDGEKLKEGALSNISEDGLVEAEGHELADGDLVTFVNVEGMTGLNDGVVR
jgi:ubiquitin-activating enzyme E1